MVLGINANRLLNMIIVGSVLFKFGEYFSVVHLIGNDGIGIMIHVLLAFTIILNIGGNILKFIDSRYYLPHTLEFYIAFQTLLIVCELALLLIFVSKVEKSAALSFLIDIAFISFLVPVIELSAYGVHRAMEMKKLEALKKD